MFCCPICSSPLSEVNRCETCRKIFPSLGTVPVLVADSEATMRRWRLRTREFIEGVSRGIAAARIELRRPDLLPSTRSRIAGSCDALAENRERIVALLDAVGIGAADADEGELETGERPSAAGYAGITEYYEQIHRDWGWPADDTENCDALEHVRDALGEQTDLGVVVVLGAGAGRLAYDLHRTFSPVATLALDINPLLMVVACRVARGETVSLIEFPLIPRDIDHVHVERDLRAPGGSVKGLLPVLADAFRPPLPDGSANTVVTPWFIDQVPKDARDAIGVVHRLLAPGGRWLNFGPLIYPKDRSYGVRYTASEILELVALSGFSVEHAHSHMADFLRSPAAGYARVEQVLTFAARKHDVGSHTPSPHWLIAPHLPIPRFDGLDDYTAPHPLLGHVAAMIDGNTSLAEVTERVVREHGIPIAVAKLGVPAAAAEVARACAHDA